MKKVLLVLITAAITIAVGCSQQKPISLDINITSGDIISGTDTIQVSGPATYQRKLISCKGPQECTEEKMDITGYFKTYKSEDLGIIFSIYAYGDQIGTQYDDHFNVIIRSGNSVHIVNNKTPDDEGQWIAAFDKLPTETIKGAIQRKFLSGYDTNCFINTITGNSIMHQQQFIIDHPASKDMKKRCKDDGLCYPDRFCGTYAIGGSVHFFMGSDTGNKVYFIEGGQDNIPGLDGNSRYTNITFQ